ncbi:LuxR C-terminal-related transcriptional regulator [Streptomyces sp. NPDC001307]|uniref:helix-turn-helix transcriptional regulator n=1 Tax=Streptomyces sp. NPDC001307 TaxID=3364560 RepID=UPI0036C2916F
MALIVQGYAALTADDEKMQGMFEAGLAGVPDLCWRYDEARMRLACGERLRRINATSQARTQLLRAGELFEAMRAAPLAARADAELRAAGDRIVRGEGCGGGVLTVQELEIAMLGATGLTNKQIAERLYLLHRAISTHLYRIFPKLGSRRGPRCATRSTPPAHRTASR